MPLLLALRYLRSTRKDAFVSFLSAVAAGGIGLGVAALVLALAALAGLQEALRAEVLARTPHLEARIGGPPPPRLEAALAGLPGVRSVHRLTRGRGWLRSRGLVQPIEIVGFDGDLPPFFPGPSGQQVGLYVSDELARKWSLEVGDRLEIVSPRPTLTPLGPTPRTRSLALAGTFEAGRTEEVERVALPGEIARSLVAADQTYLALATDSLEAAVRLRPAVQAALPAEAELATWQDLNRPLFFALRLEKAVMFVAVSLIVVVAALALVADLALVVSSKRSELGMLAAMGTDPRRLRGAFLWLGGLLAGGGILVGGGLGGAAALVLGRFQLVRLPEQVYFLDYLPFRLEAPDVLAVVAVSLTLALASSYFVAQRLERLAPVEAMRR